MKKALVTLMPLFLVMASCTQPIGEKSSSEAPLPSVSTTPVSSDNGIPSSSSSQTPDDHIAFSDVLDMLINGFARKEGKASSETLTHTTTRDAYSTVVTENASLFSDGSSRVDGTETKGETVNKYQKRSALITEKYKDGGDTFDQNIFYQVTDYENESLKDSAEKQYSYESNSEAMSYGFEQGSGYVLNSQTEFLGSLQLVQSLYSYVAVLASSPYVSQVNRNGFLVEEIGDNAKYSVSVNYSYTEEGIVQDMTYTANFIISETNNTLYSVDLKSIQTETRVDDPTDTSTYTDHLVGSITYENKGPVSANSINVSDYFLTKTTDVDVLNDQRKVVDSSDIKYGTSHYLFASPKTYLPAKAADISEWSLTPTASSNEDVVSLVTDNSGSYLEIVGVGTATLTWAYYGKNDDGVWEYLSFAKEVTINYAEIESITFGDSFTPTVTGKVLTAGTIYTQYIYLNPSYGRGTIVATSNDTDTLVVSVEQTSSYCLLKLIPLKAGIVTVTAQVEGKDGTAINETFTVSAIPESEIPDILSAAAWEINDLYLDTIVLTFDKNKTGTWTWDYTDNSGNPVHSEGEFFWKLASGKLSITGFLKDDAEYGYFNSHFAEGNALLAATPEGGYTLTLGSETYMKDYIFTRQ